MKNSAFREIGNASYSVFLHCCEQCRRRVEERDYSFLHLNIGGKSLPIPSTLRRPVKNRSRLATLLSPLAFSSDLVKTIRKRRWKIRGERVEGARVEVRGPICTRMRRDSMIRRKTRDDEKRRRGKKPRRASCARLSLSWMEIFFIMGVAWQMGRLLSSGCYFQIVFFRRLRLGMEQGNTRVSLWKRLPIECKRAEINRVRADRSDLISSKRIFSPC